MGKALPVELRERVVEAYLNQEGSYAEIAERFDVGVMSVIRWVKRKRQRDDLRPDPNPGAAPMLDATDCDILTELFDCYPTESLTQIAQRLFESTGKRPDFSTVSRYKHRLGYSQKKRHRSPANAMTKSGKPSAKRSARSIRKS